MTNSALTLYLKEVLLKKNKLSKIRAFYLKKEANLNDVQGLHQTYFKIASRELNKL